MRVELGHRYFLKWIFFFFRQKTAYKNRNCDWSSDVCSSDLGGGGGGGTIGHAVHINAHVGVADGSEPAREPRAAASGGGRCGLGIGIAYHHNKDNGKENGGNNNNNNTASTGEVQRRKERQSKR